MGKKSKKSQSGWGHEQHEARVSRKVTKLDSQQQNDADKNDDDATKNKKRKRGYERSIHLSHDSYEKKEESKLRLHISKTNREIEALRGRLKNWDEVEEQAAFKKKLEMEEKKILAEAQASDKSVKRRKKRLGPETWKLRGAARPANEVYDFDTRYVDPHIKAHEEAKAKAKRVVNVFHFCKGSFGQEVDESADDGKHVSGLLLETCRSFLSVSMQAALLNLEAKKFKSARERFLEIIELEGYTSMNPSTNARCRLMRMYIEANRPESARRLWEKIPVNYSSVWIRYSAALLEFVSWKILEEEGSTEDSASQLLVEAIKSNVFCAYYVAFYDTFEKVMEYTDDAEDAPDGSLEQAIEYFTSEQMGSWIGTEGAIDWIRKTIVDALNRNVKCTTGLNSDDLEWEEKINKIEMEHETILKDEDGQTEDEDEPDAAMFAGMFRVGMDMLSDSGELIKTYN